MKRYGLALLALLAICASALGSHTTTITITPSAPTSEDEVQADISVVDVPSTVRPGMVTHYLFGTTIYVVLPWQLHRGYMGLSITGCRLPVSLGLLSPGEYTLIVRNIGRVTGSASSSFTVTASEPDDDDDPMWPSWWSLFRSSTWPW